MRAIVLSQYGGVEQLKVKNIKVPEPNQDEVLVKVSHFSINPEDISVRNGIGGAKAMQLPIILGWDLAGIVEFAPKGSRFSTGDRVMGLINYPDKGNAYSEFVLVDQDQIVKLPESTTLLDAAASPLIGVRALSALTQLDVSEGSRVLVLGADTGVGHLLVQLLKLKSAYVVGIAVDRNRDYVKAIGVDKFIDKNDPDFEDFLDDIDVTIDCIGGEIRKRVPKVMNENGIFLSLIEEEGSPSFSSRPDIQFIQSQITSVSENLSTLSDLISEEKIKINIDKTFLIDQVKEAHELLEVGEVCGKLVVSVEQERKKIKIRLKGS